MTVKELKKRLENVVDDNMIVACFVGGHEHEFMEVHTAEVEVMDWQKGDDWTEEDVFKIHYE